MRRHPCNHRLKANAPHGALHELMGTCIPLIALIQAVTVGEHLNFRHAAAALGISQSSVSERVRALEEALEVRLFERGIEEFDRLKPDAIFLRKSPTRSIRSTAR